MHLSGETLVPHSVSFWWLSDWILQGAALGNDLETSIGPNCSSQITGWGSWLTVPVQHQPPCCLVPSTLSAGQGSSGFTARGQVGPTSSTHHLLLRGICKAVDGWPRLCFPSFRPLLHHSWIIQKCLCCTIYFMMPFPYLAALFQPYLIFSFSSLLYIILHHHASKVSIHFLHVFHGSHLYRIVLRVTVFTKRVFFQL